MTYRTKNKACICICSVLTGAALGFVGVGHAVDLNSHLVETRFPTAYEFADSYDALREYVNINGHLDELHFHLGIGRISIDIDIRDFTFQIEGENLGGTERECRLYFGGKGYVGDELVSVVAEQNGPENYYYTRTLDDFDSGKIWEEVEDEEEDSSPILPEILSASEWGELIRTFRNEPGLTFIERDGLITSVSGTFGTKQDDFYVIGDVELRYERR